MTAPARTSKNNNGDNVADTAITNSETIKDTRNNNDLQLSGVSNSNSNSISCRAVVGEGMNRFSALINDNFIAARYGVFASIALLTVS